ncbi:MAG: hypothetical protein HY790_04425 [Deltaproteobacteria bacterium]|nr:hypothetical protein [Deltaproteobacteria bacterium]
MVGLLFGMALLGFAGCACSDGVPRNMEADYGRSVTNARLEMMVTPPDAVDAKPPLGMQPQAAANVQGKYEKSFKDKEPPKVINLQLQ